MWVGSCSQLFAWGFGSFSCHPDTSTRFMGNLEMARALSLSLYLHTSESNLCTNPIASIKSDGPERAPRGAPPGSRGTTATPSSTAQAPSGSGNFSTSWCPP